MSEFTELMNGSIPLWLALLIPAVVGAFAYLRGWCDGKGIGKP